MKVPSETEALDRIRHSLADLLGLGLADVQLTRQPPGCPRIDAAVKAGRWRFIAEYKAREDAASVAQAIGQLQSCGGRGLKNYLPLVVVPFMGEVGRKKCAEAGVSWLDLSGNANLTAPQARIIIEGKPNRFSYPGRPSSVFAPKSSRIVRWLLMHPEQSPTQKEISLATGMDEGFTSRIVARLQESGLAVRNRDGRIVVPDRTLLLDAWHERYEFFKHDFLKGLIPSKSGLELLQQVASCLREKGIDYSVTGLAGGWLIDHFANFRLVTIYVKAFPPATILDDLYFREEARGANLWWVVPNDAMVFDGAEEREKINCVHPLQAYLDLKAHPERAREAAENLRAQRLGL